jgi:hypothetical protein
MHAANNNHNADTDNSVISAFYDAQTDQWHYNGWATPDGRNGYHRMLVNGRSALGVCQRAVYETTSSYARWNVLATWRKVTLFACDDLTSRPWRIRRYWLEPPFGATMIWDLFRGPDGAAYVAYDYVTAETFEDSHQPCTLHIARIHEDLSAECFDLGVPGDGGRPCPVFDRRGNWYLTYWDTTDQINYLLKLDPENGFRVTARYTLGDADTPMVLHTLRPEQFGGENDVSDTVRYVSRGYRPQGGDAYPLMDMIYGEFELPVEEAE